MNTILSIELTDDEVKYICSLIPKAHAISYFQHNEKRFHKLKPGFRAVGLNQSQVESTLISGVMRRDTFVIDFLEDHLKRWLGEISDCIDNYKQQGKSDVDAKLLTLSESFFIENPTLYFKFKKEVHSEDYILVLSNALNIIKESRKRIAVLETERDKAFSMRDEIISKNNKLNDSLSDLRLELVDTRNADKANVQKHVQELKQKEQELLKIQAKLTKAESSLLSLNKEIEKLQSDANMALSRCGDLQTSVDNITAERERYKADYDYLYNEISIENAQKEVATTITTVEKTEFSLPKKPIVMKEFAEFLEYNFENFGISNGRQLFVSHLCKVLFAGEPLIVDKTYCNNLIDCITNTLLSGQKHETLQYRVDISARDIETFLGTTGRVVCLDGFVGNYNEMFLIPIFPQYKNKIIFLTIDYDETLKYISEGFLCYARYINISHFVGLKQYPTHREDPSDFEETEYAPSDAIKNDRFSRILSLIMLELGFSAKHTNIRVSEVDCEETMNGILSFEILPYINDVLRKNPFLISENLLKYTEADRFKYKLLFKEWFNL
jgi:hypothetical protein